MQLDDMKQIWAAHGATLERAVAINERLLRETMLGKVRSTLAPFRFWRVCEMVLGLATLFLIGPVLVGHLAEPRYAIAGGATFIYAIGLTALSVAMLALARPDFDRPITEIQRTVERVRVLEYRATKWALLGGVVVWLPMLLLLVEAATGIDALARVDLAWLISNLLFGVAVLVAGHLLSKRFVESELSPIGRRVVDAFTGRSLAEATAHLAELTTFERD
jgi:hypothetical protein